MIHTDWLDRSDYIGFQFGRKIRAIAPRHTLIADIGVAGYILTVLVPELAIQLIKDDMKISKKQAHVVLKESTELGEILNDDES
jgi:RTC4-like domain